jgi:hypothetical protein
MTCRLVGHLVFVVALSWSGAIGVAAPRVLEVRTQQVEGVTYFHARLERPADLRLPTFDVSKPFSDADRGKFARLPWLVPQDEKARTVYYRHKPSQPSLNFFGRLAEGGTARFILVYPTGEAVGAKPAAAPTAGESTATAEAGLELDFDKAVAVPVPKLDPDDQHLHPDDLRSHWALHQAAHFAVLETQVLDFPFFSFAREATGRKYGVVSPPWVKRQLGQARHRLYEVTTGADAIAETLQLDRLLEAEDKPGRGEERTIPLAKVPGITVPEQPWERLLAGTGPATEPLARLVPHDNYYVYFRDLRKFIEAGNLLDEWGTNLLRVYEMKSRDYQLRQRYERQLCLTTTALGKALGPALVKGIALTGSDPYFREGTDVTVIFHVVNRGLFLAAVDGFIRDARQAHGSSLAEGRDDYHGTAIERFVTPLREVSLHRSALRDEALGEFVVYSNSPSGVRRVLDAQQGRGKRLADSSDFRYVRTIFPLKDESKAKPRDDRETDTKAADQEREDGFAFLSDAFLRQLTGPATRIKEKRRLEALTSASMLTSAALLAAWETGKLPADHAAALAAAGLRPQDVAVPEGKEIVWDPQRQLAVSDVYNTIHFSTPLVELPIDRVTSGEAEQYGRFRDEYSRLWRSYFDPIGLRLSLDEKRVRAETHILPLAGSDAYRVLREVAGRGTIRFDPSKSSVIDFQVSLFRDKSSFALHLDGGTALREMVGLLIRWEADPSINLRQEYDRLFWKLPLAVRVFGEGAESRAEAEKLAEVAVDSLKADGFVRLVKEVAPAIRHKEAVIHKLVIDAERYRELAAAAPIVAPQTPLGTFLTLLPTQEAPATLYVVGIDTGVHFSTSEEFIKKLIDQADALKKDGGAKPAPRPEVNAGFVIAPGNAREAASLLLEYEGRSLALLNNQVWRSFYQAGLLSPAPREAPPKGEAQEKDQERVRQFLGFIPVSPDGSPYQYDPRLREVVSRRHGSHRRPQLHDQVEPASDLGRLLAQIATLRAELRFHENGLHTVLTIERR